MEPDSAWLSHFHRTNERNLGSIPSSFLPPSAFGFSGRREGGAEEKTEEEERGESKWATHREEGICQGCDGEGKEKKEMGGWSVA